MALTTGGDRFVQRLGGGSVIAVPPQFAARHGGEAGQEWIASLPALVEALCRQWSLDVEDAAPMYGELGLVIAVRREGERCVLKVSWLDDATVDVARALATWDGDGAVRLLAARPEAGALLLERLNPLRSLRHLEVLEAAAVAAQLVRRLAVPAPTGIPRLQDIATATAASLPSRQQHLGDPVPTRWLDAACDFARALGARAGDCLVHGDLYYGNILAGEREPWLAIDPKPVVGDPEFSLPELLWDDRADEMRDKAALRRLLATLIEYGQLDSELARGWTVVRCVDYWLWGLANGLTGDPIRCERVLDAIV